MIYICICKIIEIRKVYYLLINENISLKNKNFVKKVLVFFVDIGVIWCNFYFWRDSDLNILEMIKKIVSVINILIYVLR